MQLINVLSLYVDKLTESSLIKSLLQMHRQIGNAVPWPVSIAIAREFRNVLFKKWIEDHKDNDAMEID